MIDIKIHKKENNQLLSIKGVGSDYSSRQYLIGLLNKLRQFTGYVLIHVRRNNYNDSSIERLKKEGEILGIRNLKIESNLFEISFDFNETEVKEDLLFILVDLWYCFQQPVYYFFLNEENSKLNYKNILNKNLSWKETVELSNSFVMFKGAEEDVVWIGKSDNLEFGIE